MSKTTPLGQVDAFGASVVTRGMSFVETITNPLILGVKKIQTIQIGGPDEDYNNPAAGILNTIYRILGAFRRYYYEILQGGDIWAKQMSSVAERFSNFFFSPLSFCQTGRAIQKSVSQVIVAKSVYFFAFWLFQTTQIIPYVSLGIAGVAVNTLYTTAPGALVPSLLGATLFLQVYFLFTLATEVRKLTSIVNGYTPGALCSWVASSMAGVVIWPVQYLTSWIPGTAPSDAH